MFDVKLSADACRDASFDKPSCLVLSWKEKHSCTKKQKNMQNVNLIFELLETQMQGIVLQLQIKLWKCSFACYKCFNQITKSQI